MNISSHFQIHTKLNPTLWENGILKPDVAKRLLTIANDFLEYVGIPLKIQDIVITGSMANFNYTKYSDIDLHIILDFSLVNQNLDLVSEFLLAKRSLWNDKHKIMIGEHEVEVYPENAGEVHHSTGIYSLIQNDWIRKPGSRRRLTRQQSPRSGPQALSLKATSGLMTSAVIMQKIWYLSG